MTDLDSMARAMYESVKNGGADTEILEMVRRTPALADSQKWDRGWVGLDNITKVFISGVRSLHCLLSVGAV